MTAAHEFWIKSDDYHNLAETYERNVIVTSPARVNCRYGSGFRCTWCASSVTYYEYEGPTLCPRGRSEP